MQIEPICQQIRSQLKARQMTQEEFARVLKTSVPTMKRWLRGEGLLFRDLSRMLEALNLRLSEVSLLAEGEVRSSFTYSFAQEETLAREEGLLAFFDQLLKGKTPTQIARKHQLTEKSLVFYLSKLEKLKLIQWLPKNKVKILVSGEPNWNPGGPLSQKFRRQIVDEHLKNHLFDKDRLRVGVYSLSNESQKKISGYLVELSERLRVLELKDSSEEHELTTIILGYGDNKLPLLTKTPNK